MTYIYRSEYPYRGRNKKEKCSHSRDRLQSGFQYSPTKLDCRMSENGVQNHNFH